MIGGARPSYQLDLRLNNFLALVEARDTHTSPFSTGRMATLSFNTPAVCLQGMGSKLVVLIFLPSRRLRLRHSTPYNLSQKNYPWPLTSAREIFSISIVSVFCTPEIVSATVLRRRERLLSELAFRLLLMRGCHIFQATPDTPLAPQ